MAPVFIFKKSRIKKSNKFSKGVFFAFKAKKKLILVGLKIHPKLFKSIFGHLN